MVNSLVVCVWLGRLLNPLVGEAVTSGPIGTLGARSSFRVVRAFFVRAADNPVGHHGGAGCVRLEEGQKLLTDGGIVAHIQVALREPAVENLRLVTFIENHADGDLGGQLVVGSVEGHGGNGIAAKSRAEVRVQPRSGGWSFLRNPFLLFTSAIYAAFRPFVGNGDRLTVNGHLRDSV